ncbi:DHA2 family efflux MFS transporter permease subunit [Paeniglutamicibacter sp. ABSL32-1]|uniref:DHA2 family efflux MFS transporter permease subunit n=1 Tax=Paeniglutamicibacter quisquiliarum TaxID=2849498 RepID=UPI001C2D1A51|nr:DHA2 family efflux MFS transporter permease subunit [Paeniglutamicibacter quisquiliarum]MBV1781039.1 DHA2 family efflux MFS transporter permease subunit [Paeniglutamicibacter quisquiliarum]
MSSDTHLAPATGAVGVVADPQGAVTGLVATSPAPTKRLSPGEVLTITVLVFSAFVAFLSEMVLGVALPQIMDDLNITATTGQWLTTGYALTLAVIIPTTGYIMQRFQLRTIFIVSVGLFTLGTLIAAVAPGFELLLVGRIVQALGTAVLVPLLMTTSIGLVAPSRRGQMMALVTAVSAVAPAVGPAFSGIVMSQLSWRWLFIIILPLSLLGLIIGAIKMPNLTGPRRIGFDTLSLALSAIGFGALVYGLASAGESDSGRLSPAFWIAVPVGAVGIAAFVWRQLRLQRRDAAVLDMRIFAHASFARPVIVFAFLVMGAFTLPTLLPLILQESLGLGSLETGLLMVPGGVTIGLVSVLVGRYYDRIGARGLAIPGVVVVGAGWWFMTTFTEDTSMWVVLAAYVLICAGQAFAWVAVFTMSLGSLPSALVSHGSAALNTIQQLGGAAGLAVLIAVLSSIAGGTDAASIANGARAAFTVGAVIAGIALIAALFLPRHARNAEAD